jgi:hypothetical protein
MLVTRPTWARRSSPCPPPTARITSTQGGKAILVLSHPAFVGVVTNKNMEHVGHKTNMGEDYRLIPGRPVFNKFA